MKMPNLSACAGSCFFVESHVAIEAAIEKRAAASEACDSSLRFPLSRDVFILIFQRRVSCLSMLEHASDVGRLFISFRPSKNLLAVRISTIAESLSIEARRVTKVLGSETLLKKVRFAEGHERLRVKSHSSSSTAKRSLAYSVKARVQNWNRVHQILYFVRKQGDLRPPRSD
jgi:hypothetical protein